MIISNSLAQNPRNPAYLFRGPYVVNIYRHQPVNPDAAARGCGEVLENMLGGHYHAYAVNLRGLGSRTPLGSGTLTAYTLTTDGNRLLPTVTFTSAEGGKQITVSANSPSCHVLVISESGTLEH